MFAGKNPSCVMLLALMLAAGVRAEVKAEPTPVRVEKLAILDFQANGVRPELATTATGLAAHELQLLGAFDVLTTDAVRAVLALERQKQLLGCSDEKSSCLTELAGALGVDYLVMGKLSRAESASSSTLTLELTLIHAASARREGSEVQGAATEAELLAVVARSATHLVARLLGQNPGLLALSSSEAGALVSLDGAAVGTTPLPEKLPLNPGPHLLTVEKEGFVRFQKELRLRPGATLEESVTLFPSPDFIAHYELRNRKLRAGAWVSTGLAAAAVAGAGLFQLHASALYGSPQTPGTFLYGRAKLLEGIESDGETNYRQSATKLQGSIGLDQTLSYVCGGVGALAAVASAYFWISGDDPRRYAEVQGQALFDAGPQPGGAYARLRVSF